jgi:hypothetical protein
MDNAGMTPRQRILHACEERGTPQFVAGCAALLEGREADDSLIVILGGDAAGYVLAGHECGPNGYWPRVWAARGLLHAWDGQATAAIIAATGDEAWRVREMAAKVIARHQVGDALDAVMALRDDAVPRVRAAAGRAVTAITAGAA